MTDARTDNVSRQYSKWTYPAPIEDLDMWHTNHWDRFDPRHAHRILWPDRPYRPDLDILIAGCGTNQAAAIAHSNPEAKVVGVDISQPSLDHQNYLKGKHGLRNLELHLLPIEELSNWGRDFDLIISSGVLHHLADPDVGIGALAQCLRSDGAMGLMLYGDYGRTGINMLQSVFRDMGLVQDEASVQVVRETLQWLPTHHLARGYLNIASDLNYDAGLVDTFLHVRERTYNTDECIDFVESAGLVFVQWLNKAPYYPNEVIDPGRENTARFYSAVNALPERQIWSVMDRVRSSNGCHFFMACRPERPKEQYTIDFSAPGSLDYVPQWRIGCRLDDGSVHRPGWHYHLKPSQLAYVRELDERRTIREIAALVEESQSGPSDEIDELEAYGRELFALLWRLDFISVAFGA